MSVDLQTDLEAFHRFVGIRIERGERCLSLEQAVAEFRVYQTQLEQLRAELQESIDQADRGLARPLDVDEIKKIVRERLAQQGIHE